MKRFTIGAVADKAGVGVETVRYSERRGLVVRPHRSSGAYRDYPQDFVARIRFVRRAQELGFTLAEIQGLLRLTEAPNAGWREVRALAEEKLTSVRERNADLKQIEATLSGLIKDCSGRGKLEGCPIIETIAALRIKR